MLSNLKWLICRPDVCAGLASNVLANGRHRKAPLRRTVTQNEVGNTAAFLLSDLSSGISGQTIYVDAGYCINGM